MIRYGRYGLVGHKGALWCTCLRRPLNYYIIPFGALRASALVKHSVGAKPCQKTCLRLFAVQLHSVGGKPLQKRARSSQIGRKFDERKLLDRESNSAENGK